VKSDAYICKQKAQQQGFAANFKKLTDFFVAPITPTTNNSAETNQSTPVFSNFLLQRKLPQMIALLVEPYAMIQVTTAWNCGCEFRYSRIRSVSVEPLAATYGTLRLRGTPVEKHWSALYIHQC